MTRKIAIVTDSSSAIDFMPHDYDNIYVIRMPITFGNDQYIDGLTISVDDFYERLKNEDIIPTTSMPSLGETMELYEQLRNDGYTDIIHYPISKGISGTYQALHSIKDAVEGITVHLMDTKATAIILGYIVLQAARLVREGKSLEEVIEYSNYLSNNYRAYFMVDDLTYLIKNGRLSNAAGFIGSFLKIKPILTFNDQGEIIGTQKIRTTKKATNYLIEAFIEDTKQYKKIQPFFSYAGDKELKEKFMQEAIERTGRNDFIDAILPAVIGAHIGYSAAAIGYFILEK
ncbi:MAG TPA: DegV family protein [Haloplasmataceae bacterium]